MTLAPAVLVVSFLLTGCALKQCFVVFYWLLGLLHAYLVRALFILLAGSLSALKRTNNMKRTKCVNDKADQFFRADYLSLNDIVKRTI